MDGGILECRVREKELRYCSRVGIIRPSFFLDIHEGGGGLFLPESFWAFFLSAPVRKEVEYFALIRTKCGFCCEVQSCWKKI